jgi:hypothetical protein
MLTVASPKVPEVEVALRARLVQQAIEQARAQAPPARAESRFTVVIGFPQSFNMRLVRGPFDLFARFLVDHEVARDLRQIDGPGFAGLDGVSDLRDAEILAYTQQFIRERLQAPEFHPDTWPPVVVRAPADVPAKLRAVAGDKYSYRDLDDFTTRIEKALKVIPLVSKVTRSGVLDEQVFLVYSQERLVPCAGNTSRV